MAAWRAPVRGERPLADCEMQGRTMDAKIVRSRLCAEQRVIRISLAALRAICRFLISFPS